MKKQKLNVKKCHWCSRFIGKKGQTTIKDPKIFYCKDCFKKGLKMEYEAIGLYEEN